MNRFLRAGILLLILSCLIGACAENLIRNPEFDQDFVSEGISFWDVDLWDNTADVTFDVEKIGIYNCLHIAAGTDNDVRWIQTVPVEPDTEYRLSGYILAQNCSEDDGARGANLSVYNSAAYSVSVYDTAGEWQYVELYGKTGPDQTELVVCARIARVRPGSGTSSWRRTVPQPPRCSPPLPPIRPLARPQGPPPSPSPREKAPCRNARRFCGSRWTLCLRSSLFRLILSQGTF